MLCLVEAGRLVCPFDPRAVPVRVLCGPGRSSHAGPRSADEGLDKTALYFWTSRLEVRLGANDPVL